MQTFLQCRRTEDRSLGMMMKEIDEDLALFLEMRGSREKEKNDLIFDNSPPVYDDSTSTASNPLKLNTFFDTLLDDPENSENDFDWLLSPPLSPSAPSIEAQVPEAPFQAEIPKEETADLESEKVLQPQSTPKEMSSTVDASEKTVISTSTSSSRRSNRKPISSGAGKSATSRLPTPSRRPLAASSKPSSTSSTLNSKGTSCSTKPMAPPMKSSIPSKSAARSSSTPPARSALSSSSKKASARSVTPTPKPSSVSGASCCPSIDKKTGSKTVTGSKTSRGISPPVRSRPKVTSEVLVSSSNAPPNTKFPATKWPSLASKERPTSVRSRQKACSPLREKANVGTFNTMNTSYRVSRGYSNGNIDDEVNPVLEGTKMVERVVNMRKLAPPKDDYQSLDDHHVKKSSLDKSGFGRSLSKKSLDMAIRHMDITNGAPVNLNRKRIPASCVSSLSSRRVTKTGALLSQLTSTDSEDSVSSSSIAADGCGIGSDNKSYF